jgi:hypothetical protein
LGGHPRLRSGGSLHYLASILFETKNGSLSGKTAQALIFYGHDQSDFKIKLHIRVVKGTTNEQ